MSLSIPGQYTVDFALAQHLETPKCPALADLGGVPGTCPPYRIQFFHFCIHFHRKAPMSEVHPPMGNPGSATALYVDI